MKYLGIDYGKKKVGLAFSEGLFANPLKVLEVSSLKDALEKVKHVLKTEQIDKIVIGVAESGESRKMTKNFIKEIGKEVEVVEVDETLSSYNAKQKMIELGVKNRSADDSYSATIILQNYLDNINKE